MVKKNKKVTEVTENEVPSTEAAADATDSEGVKLNVDAITEEIEKGATGKAQRIINDMSLRQKIDYRRILVLGDNTSRMASMLELSKSPKTATLVNSLIELGFDSTQGLVILRRVRATAREIMANINFLTAAGANIKHLDGGVYGSVKMDEELWAKWVQGRFLDADTEQDFFLPVAGFRRCMSLPIANFGRTQLKLVESSYVDAVVVPEGTEDEVLVELNVVENTKKNRGIEVLVQADYIKSAVEKIRRDPYASKTAHANSLGLPRATAEKYLEMAQLAIDHPLLRFGEISGRVVDAVPSEMKRLVKIFNLSEAQERAAYEAIYSFKGIASSSELQALQDGRLAPHSEEPLKEKMAEYRKEFAEWITARRATLLASLTTETGLTKKQVEALLAEKVTWTKAGELAVVAYLLYKSRILSGGKTNAPRLSASSIGGLAEGLEKKGLGTIASVFKSIADGDEEKAKKSADILSESGPAITLVLKLVENFGLEPVMKELNAMSDRL